MSLANGWDMTDMQNFTGEQKEYLKGFFEGIHQRGLTFGSGVSSRGENSGEKGNEEETIFGTPLEDVCKEERIKHEQHGLDCWDTMVDHANRDVFPNPADTFRFKFHGLFYVSPAQESFMLRCRIAGCQLRADQFEGLALMSEEFANGKMDLTTRGNVQVREIPARNTVKVLNRMVDLGLTARGSGADNLRNITASPTSGFDPVEVMDVLPLAKDMHHYIMNNRDMYGLPRKFNISFDSGGSISVCADSNDIAFYAVRVGEGKSVEPGVYFRVQLGGISGHKQLATDTGLLIQAEDCVPFAAAMVRVFIENGDRENRKKSRLKYLLDNWGYEKFIEESEKKLGRTFPRFDLSECEPRASINKHGHYGVYPQKQEGLNVIGVVVPVGRLSKEQAVGLAEVSRRFGKSDIRLTAWQNLMIPHVHDDNVGDVKQAILALGLDFETSSVQGGLVACTGNAGCKFASANTKKHAVEIGAHLKDAVQMDKPINFHLTGCHHSCAQHYCGDVGMIATKVKQGEETVEGYNVVVGGGVDDEHGIGREIYKSVPATEVPGLSERLVQTYLDNRENNEESFVQFTRRHEIEDLKELVGELTYA